MLHLASVQIDFVPSAVTPGRRLWTPAEPLAWGSGDIDPEASLANLAEHIPTFGSVRTQIQSSLVEFQNRRLEQILSFLEKASIDLCVFPEYAFIADRSTLRIFAGFAPRITIVAGLGVLRSTGVEALAAYSEDIVAPNTNVVIVFSGSDCHIVAKKHPAEGEVIGEGNGARSLSISTGGQTVQLGIAICKDYLVAGPSLGGLAPTPDILAIPAYTNNLAAFSPEAPRDFPRILTNHSRYGGSTIFAAGCQDRFVERGVPRPIPAGAEGIIAVKWFGAPERPTPLLKEQNRVSIRSAMVSGSDGKAAADIVRAFRDLAQSKPSNPDGLQEVSRWLDYLRDKPRLALIADALQLYRQASNDDLVTPELGEQLARHFVAPETQSVADHWRQALLTITRQIQDSLRTHSDDINTYKLLLTAAERYAVARGDEDSTSTRTVADGESAEVRCHFSIGLGRFDSSEAVRTLSDQQDLLLMFARSAPAGSRVTYRLETLQDPATGNVSPHFLVDFFGPSDENSKLYFTSLQRIARSVFLRGWETYTGHRQVVSGHRVDIIPKPGVRPKIREDLGFLVDVVRAIGGGCALEISGLCGVIDSDGPTDVAFDGDVSSVEFSDGKGTSWFLAQAAGTVNIGLRVTLTTPERNDALASLVGAALFSGGECEIVEATEPDAAVVVTYPVEVAHRILHPPHGHIEGRGLGSRRPLFVPVTDFAVVGDGAVIGTASAARPFVDDELEIRIPDASRLLHTYVIGRTGVGKTNTLKNLARHDLGRPGTAIVIDPHGDLFDYAVRHATFREPLIALDFTGDHVPSLNPIYLDANDEAGILDNIEELIEIIVNSMYYEWAGPRFTDLLRLCLHTLVVIADEGRGEWAYVGDVLKLIEDKLYRQQAVRRLRERKRSDLAQRWELHQRMQATEQAEVEQWFISKFGDFRSSGVLAKATSGKPSVNLERALRDGAALLVKVPRTTLGAGPSRFLGSFIVERVLRYTMEGSFLNADAPATLIVDEFQNFVGTSFVTLIPEARKFNLGITVANQTLSQLSNFSSHEGRRNDGLSQVILGNVGNLIIQGLGRHDAERLAAEVGMATNELSRIGKYSGLVVLTVNGERLDPFTIRLSNSDERPGVVAGAVAVAQVEDALKRAGADVVIPAVDRADRGTGGVTEHNQEPPQPDSAPTTDGSGSFLDEWLKKRHKSADDADPSGPVIHGVDQGQAPDDPSDEADEHRPGDAPRNQAPGDETWGIL